MPTAFDLPCSLKARVSKLKQEIRSAPLPKRSFPLFFKDVLGLMETEVDRYVKDAVVSMTCDPDGQS